MKLSKKGIVKARIFKKKAMTPLFSTIILIVFAIALGGVVISWGKTNYSAQEDVIDCKKTSLSLIDYGQNKGICSKNNRIYFTIQNNGEIDLDGIKFSILGDNGIYPTNVNNKIKVADIIQSDVGYSNVGKIEKVIFTPKFILSGTEKVCPKNGFSIDEVGEC